MVTELNKQETVTGIMVPRDRIVSMLSEKIYHEAGNILEAERKKRAESILDNVFSMNAALRVEAEITGSRANNELSSPGSVKDRDIDIHLIPTEGTSPKRLSQNLRKYLEGLPSKTIFTHGVNSEGGREYAGFSIGLEGRVALVAPLESLQKGTATSMRIVIMQKPYPWGDPKTKSATHENPTAKTPIAEFGFASYENGAWVSSKEFDPTQKFVIKMVDANTFQLVSTVPAFDGKNINLLSPKSRAVLMLRSYAAGLPIADTDLDSFDKVTGGSFYIFRYNLAASLKKVEEGVGISALTDTAFVEKVIRFTHPYMYKVIKSFGPNNAQVGELFKYVALEANLKHTSFLKTLSLAKQLVISESDPKNSTVRDRALIEGRKVETELFSFEANRKAAVKTSTELK